jgi:hypothetical protein
MSSIFTVYHWINRWHTAAILSDFSLLCPLTSFPHLTCRSYDVVSRHDCDVTAFGPLYCTSRLHLSKALQLADLVFSYSVISLSPSNTVICGSNITHEMNMGASSVLFCPVCVNAAGTGRSLFSTTGLRHSENGRPWATLAYGAVERARCLCGWMDIETVAGRKCFVFCKASRSGLEPTHPHLQ